MTPTGREFQRQAEAGRGMQSEADAGRCRQRQAQVGRERQGQAERGRGTQGQGQGQGLTAPKGHQLCPGCPDGVFLRRGLRPRGQISRQNNFNSQCSARSTGSRRRRRGRSLRGRGRRRGEGGRLCALEPLLQGFGWVRTLDSGSEGEQPGAAVGAKALPSSPWFPVPELDSPCCSPWSTPALDLTVWPVTWLWTEGVCW